MSLLYACLKSSFFSKYTDLDIHQNLTTAHTSLVFTMNVSFAVVNWPSTSFVYLFSDSPTSITSVELMVRAES